MRSLPRRAPAGCCWSAARLGLRRMFLLSPSWRPLANHPLQTHRPTAVFPAAGNPNSHGPKNRCTKS